MSKSQKTSTSWSGVKSSLAGAEAPALMALIHDLYALSKDNQAFLHARFGLGSDVLKPYKATIDRWLSPDVFRNQDISVAKAKKAITDFKKVGGDPAALAELMVYFCEQGAAFGSQYGIQDEPYLSALVHMFEQALKTLAEVPVGGRAGTIDRLALVRDVSENLGYGVAEDMGALFAAHGMA